MKKVIRTNQETIEVLEIELAFIEKELDKPSILKIALDCEKYWIRRKYDLIKQIEDISINQNDLAKYLEIELKFAKKQMRLADKECKRILKLSQHWVWCRNEIMKQLKWRKEASNG